MEFNRLLSQAISFYGESSQTSNNQPLKPKAGKIDTKIYKNIIDEEELDKLIKVLNEKSVISVDTETSSLDPIKAELVGISFCYAQNQHFIFL